MSSVLIGELEHLPRDASALRPPRRRGRPRSRTELHHDWKRGCQSVSREGVQGAKDRITTRHTLTVSGTVYVCARATMCSPQMELERPPSGPGLPTPRRSTWRLSKQQHRGPTLTSESAAGACAAAQHRWLRLQHVRTCPRWTEWWCSRSHTARRRCRGSRWQG